ncbi:MAG: nucleotidyltransferase domain-containing protein, partial [Atopobiaceae bacterium]|nr:nucleotidyltransferase domain-containing protein [Atopobiaceae bacterium]
MTIEQVFEQIVELARTHGAKCVILFGSRARGDNGPRSDIDLAVKGCNEFHQLEEDLQENLWSLLELDIVNLDGPISDALRS